MLVVTQGFHPKILLLIQQGQTAAWLLALVGGGICALLLWPVAAALRAIPRGNLLDLAEAVLGRWGGMVTALLFASVPIFAAGMILRETSEMAVIAVFPHTPQTFATTALMIGALFVAWGEGSALVRVGRLLLPMLLISLVLVLIGTVGWGKLRFLLPLWGPGVPHLLVGLQAGVAVQFPVVVLPVLADRSDDPSGLVRWLPAVPLLSGAVLALIEGVLLMVFPYPITIDIPYPLHTAARLVMGGRFFERLEAIWVFVWVTATIILLGSLLYTASRLYAQAFRLPRRQTAILPLATALLVFAYFPRDHAQTIQWHLNLTPPFFYLVFLYPAVLGLVALIRRRRIQG